MRVWIKGGCLPVTLVLFVAFVVIGGLTMRGMLWIAGR